MINDDTSKLSAAVMKAIKSSQLGVVKFTQVPNELLAGEVIDLSRWSMALTDKKMEVMAQFAKKNPEHNYLDSTKPSLKEMFYTFWERRPSTGIVSLNISGAKDVTDYGLACIARNCRTLTELKMSGCVTIGDAGIREIGLHCSLLKCLHMSACHNIEGGGFISIAECCPLLSDVDISQCRKLQRWGIHKLFEGCHKLEEVRVSHLTCVGDEEVRVLAQSNPHLMSFIAVEAINVSDTGVLALSQHCFDLEHLDVSRKQMTTRITDVSLLALGERSLALRELRVNGCDNISDVGLNWLSIGCRALEVLDLGGCVKITDAGLRSIGTACNTLQTLIVSNAKYVSDVGVSSISAGCPQLKQLVCNGLYLLADPRLTPISNKSIGKRKKTSSSSNEEDEPWKVAIGVAALSKRCPNLTSLDVSGCFRLNIVLRKNLAKGLKNLKKLTMVGCNQVETASLVAVAEGCVLLEEINLSDCGPSVNTMAIQAFATNCTLLHTIEIARCDNVRGGAIKAIATCENLDKLDISGCRSLVDSSILSLCEVDKVPKLRAFYLLDIPTITDTSLAWIATGCTNLQILCFKGTGITRQACRAVKDSFPYSDMIFNPNFAGFWPKSRLKDRILMNDYYRVQYGVRCIQAFTRKMIATRRVEHIKEMMKFFRSALLVQKAMRIFRAKKEMFRLREEQKKLSWCAIKIVSIMRVAVAKRRVRERREKRVFMFRTKKAIIIQVAYRNYRTKKTVLRMQKAFLEMIRKRRWAIRVLQNMAKMFQCKKTMRNLREHILAQTRVRRKKAINIQRCYRGYVARNLVYYLREHLATVHETRVKSAIKIQRLFRSVQTKCVLNAAVTVKQRRVRGAIRLQAAIRGKLARLEYMEMLLLRQEAQEDHCSRVIQNRWRVKKAMLVVSRIKERRRLEFLRRSAAATVFSKHWRAREARILLKELMFQRDESIRLRVQTEYFSAIKIQALYRGIRGRLYFDQKLREKKGKWKELMDEDSGKRFFYNKLTGEIRWRMPQDLLDLIPRPTCDNCQRFEAGVECGVCNEFFCHKCWGVIHSGGRRKDHEFRALFDYYGKRIDYGDGNYPCKWPSEVQQDDVQGWMLRVAPIREPVAVYGDWEHYFTSRDEDPNYDTYVKDGGSSFFFNRKTFEATYDPPPELQQVEHGNETLEIEGGVTLDSTFDNTYENSLVQTSYTNDSSYYDQTAGYYDQSGTWVSNYDGSDYGGTSYDQTFGASYSSYES